MISTAAYRVMIRLCNRVVFEAPFNLPGVGDQVLNMGVLQQFHEQNRLNDWFLHKISQTHFEPPVLWSRPRWQDWITFSCPSIQGKDVREAASKKLFSFTTISFSPIQSIQYLYIFHIQREPWRGPSNITNLQLIELNIPFNGYGTVRYLPYNTKTCFFLCPPTCFL